MKVRKEQSQAGFVAIRRRGSRMIQRLNALPAHDWQTAFIDIPKRRHQRISYVDEFITLGGNAGEIRQVVVKGLDRDQPTLFLANNFEITVRKFD
ncbi:MAG: hypothetical protein KDA84_07515 [Planctomycetaceae bacterium]|nr:hypothetical protein [Planctomycetaceae bacterium]